MSDGRIYVCEWVKKDFSFIQDGQEFSCLANYDYTYHISLEQAQQVSSMKYRGYAWGKGKIYEPNDPIEEKPFHKTINCECIWIYDNNFSIGRYVMQNGKWIYDAYCEAWHQNWEEMLNIPLPIQE
jgi:hypothetical protein